MILHLCRRGGDFSTTLGILSSQIYRLLRWYAPDFSTSRHVNARVQWRAATYTGTRLSCKHTATTCAWLNKVPQLSLPR